ncbi:MAG: hypothetical protein A2Y18_00885 [Clostridiales bacterium GWD2_32_19]|nr:MAG: hypothetical protein A2Y18_00885 [Clostridiales bacterium GWD2_32_19]
MEVKYTKRVHLKNYDYSDDGFYFITICTHAQKHLFGTVVDSVIYMNEKGLMVEEFWNDLTVRFSNINLDKFIIMPNHIHGIVQIKNNAEISIHDIVCAFKSLSTNEYIKGVKELGWEKFDKKIWQISYFEHIIRNEKELYEIRKYIEQNPIAWELEKDTHMNNYL